MPFLEYFLTSLPSPLKGERQFDFLVLTGDYSSTYVRVLQYFRESTGKTGFDYTTKIKLKKES